MATNTVARPVDLLLVEDNPADVRLVQEALKNASVPVQLSVARDGVEALEFLRREGKFLSAPRPKLVLLDLNLPRKNGREVLSEIKTDPELKRIPVVVMTTSTAPQDIDKSYSLNANCYVTKPAELDDFFAVIRCIERCWLNPATMAATP
jgi:CheY-like chemotaxis protein